MRKIQGFYAYPSADLALAESIRRSIDSINSQVAQVSIKGWQSLSVTGKNIISEVRNQIDSSGLFICDLTYINSNVLFELGYAIAKRKKIWITLDGSLNSSEETYKKLKILTTTGYASYRNSVELSEKFISEKPYKDLESTIYGAAIQKILPEDLQNDSGIFYLKSSVATDASIELSILLEKSSVSIITDDPSEATSHPLDWYAENVYKSSGVIIHFMDDKRRENSLQDAKYALIAGMAVGFDKNILLLAHKPCVEPIDYREMLFVHSTASECVENATAWIKKIELKERTNTTKNILSISRHKLPLQKIKLGEITAENEKEKLANYFVITEEYRKALHTTNYMAFIGRKGSGKTANLFQIVEDLSKDKQNLVCVIKPIDYQFEGVLELFNSTVARSVKGFVAQSLWKYLVYTELTVTLYDEMVSRPPHHHFTENETNLMEYVKQHSEIVIHDFSVRLERIVREIISSGSNQNISIEEQQNRLTGILYNKILRDLMEKLSHVLFEKKSVFVLVDNLDKAWQHREDIDVLSKFLFGLFSVGEVITQEFGSKNFRRKSIELSLVLFLRSDIFSHIKHHARERDKLEFTRMTWNDVHLLQRVIEERFINSVGNKIQASQIWIDYFTPKVKGIDTKFYISSRIIPRPRDIIDFCRRALHFAINRNHLMIEEPDILSAEQGYSQHAYDSAIVEMEVEYRDIKLVLDSFAGEYSILTKSELNDILRIADVPESDFEKVVELLIDTAFLGREISANTFEYTYDENRKDVLRIQGMKTAAKQGLERYQINVPFRAFLNIKNDSSEQA